MTIDQKNFKILGISHIGIAAKKPTVFSQFLTDLLGLSCHGEEIVASQMTRTHFFSSASIQESTDPVQDHIKPPHPRIESLEAEPPQEGPIFQFLEKRGGGIHHIALSVDDLAKALQYLESKGIMLIDKKPRVGAGGHLIAFIHPHATGGILVELCQHSSADHPS